MRNHLLTIASLLLALSLTGWCQTSASAKKNTRGSALADVFEIAKQLEIAPMPKPSWASRSQPPIFRVAWMTDLHITDQKSIDLVTAACHAIRDDLKPNFTMIMATTADMTERT